MGHIAMASRRPIVGGNWKCNPATAGELGSLIEIVNKCDTTACDVFVCPSPMHVALVADKLTSGAIVCPQNCNFKGCGAFTGESSVEQMKDMDLDTVLIGHSERREHFGESNEFLATKVQYALDAGMKVVLCIGEKVEVRRAGFEATMAVIDEQLAPMVGMLDASKVVIAYEPVWAIGTGEVATPEIAQETHAGIRKWISEKVSPEVAAAIRIQYGGSVKGSNAAELGACPDIDGFLVGGASLKPEFVDIVASIK